MDILLASVILVIVVKTTVAATITKAFGYNLRTSVIVSLFLKIFSLLKKCRRL